MELAIQWGLRLFEWGQVTIVWGVKLTTYLHFVLRLRMCGAIFPLHHIVSWCGAKLNSGTT
jgi:hypothetical protein